jgi:hypothetical protein
MITKMLTAGAMVLMSADAHAEIANVKYRGLVDLKPFMCTDTVSSFVHRVCYDKTNSYMLILLRDTWYHYCEIDEKTVVSLVTAESVGRYYNANIRGTGNDGPFECRTHKVPHPLSSHPDRVRRTLSL